MTSHPVTSYRHRADLSRDMTSHPVTLYRHRADLSRDMTSHPVTLYRHRTDLSRDITYHPSHYTDTGPSCHETPHPVTLYSHRADLSRDMTPYPVTLYRPAVMLSLNAERQAGRQNYLFFRFPVRPNRGLIIALPLTKRTLFTTVHSRWLLLKEGIVAILMLKATFSKQIHLSLSLSLSLK